MEFTFVFSCFAQTFVRRNSKMTILWYLNNGKIDRISRSRYSWFEECTKSNKIQKFEYFYQSLIQHFLPVFYFLFYHVFASCYKNKNIGKYEAIIVHKISCVMFTNVSQFIIHNILSWSTPRYKYFLKFFEIINPPLR